MALGQERASTIANMESMGFKRTDIDAAMRAAFFNPDRAVEYLLNGIRSIFSGSSDLRNQQRGSRQAEARKPPLLLIQPLLLPPPPATSPSTYSKQLRRQVSKAEGQEGREPASGASAAGAAAAAVGNLDFLRNNPQFQQLRQLVQQQPQMLEPILQQVSAGNPQLAQLITQRPEEFMQLLAEENEDDAALPPGAQAISVTEEERDAIDRVCNEKACLKTMLTVHQLCRLGFERNLVIQAYFACDKNEELAANFLFEQPEDDDPTQ